MAGKLIILEGNLNKWRENGVLCNFELWPTEGSAFAIT